MNYNHQAIYPGKLVHPKCSVTAANTNFDGTGTLATLYTAPTGGAILISLTVQAIMDTTAGFVNVFIDDGAGNIDLYKSIPVTATTITAGSTPPFRDTLTPDSGEGIYLPAGYIIKLGTYTGDDFKGHAEVGEIINS